MGPASAPLNRWAAAYEAETRHPGQAVIPACPFPPLGIPALALRPALSGRRSSHSSSDRVGRRYSPYGRPVLQRQAGGLGSEGAQPGSAISLAAGLSRGDIPVCISRERHAPSGEVANPLEMSRIRGRRRKVSGAVAYCPEASHTSWRCRKVAGGVAKSPEGLQMPRRRGVLSGGVATSGEASHSLQRGRVLLRSCRNLGGEVANHSDASQSLRRGCNLAGVCDRAARQPESSRLRASSSSRVFGQSFLRSRERARSARRRPPVWQVGQ